MADDETTKAISFPEHPRTPRRDASFDEQAPWCVSTHLSQVQRFYEEVLGAEFPDKPRRLPVERYKFKVKHLQEELTEFQAAWGTGDVHEQVDALVDIAYVALGALIEMGIHPGAAFDEVHRANMHRERRPTRRGAGTFDAVKPEGWVGPNLYQFLDLSSAEIGKLIEDKQARTWARNGLPLDERRPKILVIGHGRHGKDTVCGRLKEKYGLRFTSSSEFCAEHVVFPKLSEFYEDWRECFGDRHNRREEWYRIIGAYNTPDKTMLARAILKEHDVYCGLRSRRELYAVRAAGLFDAILWVDAQEREGPEGEGSMTLEPWMADHVVDNNGTIEEMHASLEAVMQHIRGQV